MDLIISQHYFQNPPNSSRQIRDDKFELIIHKHKPKSPAYELPFLSELMSYTVSTGESITPVQTFRDPT